MLLVPALSIYLISKEGTLFCIIDCLDDELFYFVDENAYWADAYDPPIVFFTLKDSGF